MGTRGSSKEKQMRVRLAQEAARILVESGGQDYFVAKRKAAIHLGAEDTKNMPSNTEVEQALFEYQRLFRSNTQPQILHALREEAVRAMDFFDTFRPKLVGPVLQGTADENTPITLHLFAATVEDIGLFLMHHQIPYEIVDKRLRLSGDQQQVFACYCFLAGKFKIVALVFTDKKSVIPMSPVDGKPMRRAGIAELQEMLTRSQLPI